MNIIQLVRDYGPVGGMEGYVWNVTRAMAEMGHSVIVICNQNHCDENSENIEIYEFHGKLKKPRWLQAVLFSNRCSEKIDEIRKLDTEKKWTIFSHERTSCHDFATFHGPPFATTREKPFWKKLSLRHFMNVRLEQNQVCWSETCTVIPVSVHIKSMLEKFYTDEGIQLTDPIVPGVDPQGLAKIEKAEGDNKVIGFVGKEWKRKGLIFALDVFQELSKTCSELEFWIIGADEKAIFSLVEPYKKSLNIKTWGYVENRLALFNQLDLLIHPAKAEPFGMIITEALTAGVPVLISDNCGAKSEVTQGRGKVMSLNDDLENWSATAAKLLKEGNTGDPYARNWNVVAQEYLKLAE